MIIKGLTHRYLPHFLPLSILSFLLMVNVIQGKENITSTESILDTCLNDVDKSAILACEHFLKDDPDNLLVLINQSEHLADKQQYDAAIKLMQLASQYFPNSKKVEHQLKKLVSFQNEQQWRQNRKKALPEDKSEKDVSTNFQLNRIRCLRLTGTMALKACDEAIREKNDDYMLYKARGKILEDLGRSDEAARDFKLWVRLNPANLKTRDQIVDQKEETTSQTGSTSFSVPSQLQDTSNIQSDTTPPISDQQLEMTVEPQTQIAPIDLTQKLSTLKELHEKSLISGEEYERRKETLLDSVVAIPKSEPSRKGENVSINPEILGNYHALVIGEQNYQFLPKLKAARKDAVDVSQVLKDHYGFNVKTLLDVTRRDILLALSDYRSSLSDNDNLLIYYAGHGWLDEKADTGYWLPIEAVENNQVDWISMATLTAAVRALEAKHVLIVADSCFSGKLARGLYIQQKTTDYLARIARKRTRVVLTSGGLEPVLDGGGKEGHSVFATTFIQALKENREIIDGSTLFTRIRRPVMLKAQQVPEYSDIRMAGHEGGDFIFLPLKVDN